MLVRIHLAKRESYPEDSTITKQSTHLAATARRCAYIHVEQLRNPATPTVAVWMACSGITTSVINRSERSTENRNRLS